MSSPILALPDWSNAFLLDTYASDTGIGAVLSQVQGGRECVIAYASRSLTKPEHNYYVTRRELLAVITFVQHFRPLIKKCLGHLLRKQFVRLVSYVKGTYYLLGAPFTILTDHGALSWIHKFKEPEGQIAQWVQKLQEYEFSIIHCPGACHQNADAMSRIPCKQCGIVPADEVIALAAVTTPNLALLCEYSPEELRASQLNDPCICLVLTYKEANQRLNRLPNTSLEDKRLWQSWDQLTVVNGLLYRICNEPKQNRHWFN